VTATDQPAPRLIAIVNQKGGVGKTTTAVNLGASLALLGHRVLLADIDPQGNTTTGVGVDKRAIPADSYGVLLEDLPVADAARPTDVDNLWILPATLRLAGAEVELVGTPEREWRLAHALAPVAHAFDYILIDCPPSLGLLTLNALCAAREIIIPVQAEFYALEGLSQLNTIVEQVRANLNPALTILGVLITMFDGRTRLAMEVLDEVHRFFPNRVFHTQIPRNIRLSEAPSFGKPAVLFDPKSRGAQAYLLLARETVGGIGSVEALV
jgi:chromosome partitioning protein